MSEQWQSMQVPEEMAEILSGCPIVHVASSVSQLVDMACGGKDQSTFCVAYDLPDGRRVVDAEVARLRNGVVANYPDPYMRRRDPDCMVIADDMPTDKPTYRERFGEDFDRVREEAFAWLMQQELAVFAFHAGQPSMGVDAVALVPANAGFFALGLAVLQGILDPENLPSGFQPRSVIYVVPPFRHTHFGGKQVVVHNRRRDLHELFSFNLYPGPSAKKGVYGVLIAVGEVEGWITAHCSTVRVRTPYDNETTFMHEGASGGGKSEMLEYPHRESDGRLLLGRNLVSDDCAYVEIPRTCELYPVTDDMALCHPCLTGDEDRLRLTDAEDGWFVRVNHILEYGTDPLLEKLTVRPDSPLLFLNIDASPDSRAMLWEHTMDAPDTPCPNPRVIIPRALVPNIVDDPVSVDIRSIGVRTPPCTRESPSYGIMGLFHVLPPALAWLWRLVAPRGYANPSIVQSDGLSSEGVGSYWPFATGRRVDQANLLLGQIVRYADVRYILCPNQHIGAWKTGFMPQWITREYLARRGNADFTARQIRPAQCSLLGYALQMLQVEGREIPRWFLETQLQEEVGEDGYDQGAEQLTTFFHQIIPGFLSPDLDPIGRRIIECCLDGGGVEDYRELIPL